VLARQIQGFLDLLLYMACSAHKGESRRVSVRTRMKNVGLLAFLDSFVGLLFLIALLVAAVSMALLTDLVTSIHLVCMYNLHLWT